MSGVIFVSVSSIPTYSEPVPFAVSLAISPTVPISAAAVTAASKLSSAQRRYKSGRKTARAGNLAHHRHAV